MRVPALHGDGIDASTLQTGQTKSSTLHQRSILREFSPQRLILKIYSLCQHCKAIEDEAEYLNVPVEWGDAIPLIASIDWVTAAVIARSVSQEVPELPDIGALFAQRSLRVLGRVTVGAEWGYEMQELTLPFERWIRILRGESWSTEEPYWYEGERYTSEWSFDGTGGLVVSYDDGA